MKESLSEIVLETLRQAFGSLQKQNIYHDLDFVSGSWKEDKECDKALKAQEQIDEEVWL